ncbi:MAG: orotate phosphoribosyltransferase [Paludibacter sp.]|jgi:orotate phosphoribosyltransferase|nr:orotate phosphoribosyltransferase [Paludibacter sp.]
MKLIEKQVANKLLRVKAVKLQPRNPFSWASGWKSPIYCDNRKTLSYPQTRTYIKTQIARIILENYPEVEVIAGVATGAIAQAALVADELGLPLIYVRPTPKDHGLENLIEGDLRPRQKVVVIEDLISTGGSSLKAVEAIRNDGSEVLGMIAIFSYSFPVAEEKFRNAKVKLTTLCNYNAVLAEALATNYITEDDIETLNKWREDPSTWTGE